MQKADDGNDLPDRFNDFVQRNRKALFFTLGAVVLLFTGLIVFLSVNSHMQREAIAEVEELSRRFAEIGFLEDNYDELENLLVELNVFTARNRSGYAGGRAWTIIGRIYSDREEWPEAEYAWYRAAKTASRTYLAPVAYFNAAVAAEENGNLERAIELLEKSISHRFEFVAAPRAQFAIGRLNEQLENFPAAIDAYRQVIVRWPFMTTWANMAQSRIIAIEVGNR